MMQEPPKKKADDAVKEPMAGPAPKYHVDEKWFAKHSRSLEAMIEMRTNEMDDEQNPKKKKKGTVSMAELSKLEGFVTPELPLLEAVFRLILVHQNKPMDVDQISQELQERGIGILDARVVKPLLLARILDADFHYGIKRL